MSDYKGIKGFQVQTRTEDPTPYAQALADNPYAGAWGSGGNMNTARKRNPGDGTQTSALIAGGDDGGTTPTFTDVEEYNGSSWSEVAELNAGNSRQSLAGANAEAILEIGGENPPTNTVESWNGSAWTEVAELNTGRYDGAAGGTYTSAILAGGNSGSITNVTETWNGSSWTETGDLNTSRQALAGDGITTAMIVAGGTTGSNVAVSETFNGSTWTEVNDLNTARHFFSGAGSTTDIIVMGGNPRSTITENYNGSSWSEVNDMATARDENTGRAGTGTTALMAGGNGNPGGANLATTEEWTFSGIDPSTTPAADYADAITGDFYYNSTSGQFKTVNTGGAPIGTWASGSNLNTARSSAGGFGTQTAALAAGGSPGSGVTAVTENYNGTSWTEVNDLNTARYIGNFQFGTTTNGIVAGGSTGATGTPTQAIVEEWNGTAWTEVGDLNKNKADGGASGTYTAGVIFGGFTFPGGPPTYVILGETETWNGSAWTEVNDLNNTRYTNAGAKGGTSTSSLTWGRANQSPDAIVESWDGTNWTEVGDLNEGRESPGGAGTQTAAMAFGGTPNAALNEIWNGSSWTEANDLSTGRSALGSSGTTNTEALAFGGTAPSTTAATEEFTASDFQIKTVTTS